MPLGILTLDRALFFPITPRNTVKKQEYFFSNRSLIYYFTAFLSKSFKKSTKAVVIFFVF